MTFSSLIKTQLFQQTKNRKLPSQPFRRNENVSSVTKKDALEIQKNKNTKKSKKQFRVEK